jgi:hypothetical protein
MSESGDCHSVVSSARYTDGGTKIASSSKRSIYKLAQRVVEKLCHEDDITTKEHLEACQSLSCLMSAVSRAGLIPKEVQIYLMCTSSSLLRRLVRLRDDLEAPQSAKNDERNFTRTLTLIFTAIAALDLISRDGVPANPESSQKALEHSRSGSWWQTLCKHTKRKVVADEIDEFERKRIELEELADRPYLTNIESASWRSMLTSPSATASAALQLAGWLVFRSQAEDLKRLEELAFTFARSTVAQMHSQLLQGETEGGRGGSSGDEFLTLQTRDLLAETNTEAFNEAIESIISAAESESGQTILRDMVSSFVAPRDIVGVRRELLLNRETAEKLSIEYPWISALAHDAAMAGAGWIWKNSKSEFKRTCALLSGLAVLCTTGSGDDLARKSRAFNGRVQLPFLETNPAENALTLALVPTRRSWVLYNVSEEGKPNVTLCKRGFDGLVAVALGLQSDIFKR